jgi:hypothetical protein
MSTATKTRVAKKGEPVEFTCARCEVTSRWTEGLGAATPPNWVKEKGLYYCLACRRERAMEQAVEKAGGERVSTADRAKLRSAAVVDFEIARDPDRTEGEIAKAARASIGAVRKARRGRRPE